MSNRRMKRAKHLYDGLTVRLLKKTADTPTELRLDQLLRKASRRHKRLKR